MEERADDTADLSYSDIYSGSKFLAAKAEWQICGVT